MTSLNITVQNKRLLQAIDQGPEVLNRHLNKAVLRTVKEMARAARRKAPQADGILLKSIHHRMADPLTGLVLVGVDYGQMVEDGTGPGGSPPIQDLIDWIKVKRIEPNDPEMDQRDLAFVMARSIAINGTPAQPYLQPAFDSLKKRADNRISRAIGAAVREISA